MIMLDPETLPSRQKSVFEYIAAYQKDHGIAPTIREICDHFGLRSPGGVHRVLSVLKEKGYIHAETGKKRSWRTGHSLITKGLPVVGAIAAGNPLEALENIEEVLGIDPELFGSETCFALRVRGDSMIDAHILDGDIAVIRPQGKVENGEIAAVLVQDVLPEATLKRVYKDRTSIRLHAENESYTPLIFKGRKRGVVSIIGKMVGILRC
ncbi:MAG: transcriptional repressor LexA [Thermodesulfobacteriota bacterium]|nr:transcriptional repressor LexA [Thermodesulfobacteriota bacterium]